MDHIHIQVMDSKCYAECEENLKNAVAENAKCAPNQITGHVWCAISDDEKTKPELFGPLRYKVPQGMQIYKKITDTRLSEENKKVADTLIENGADFIVFVHAEHQCITAI